MRQFGKRLEIPAVLRPFVNDYRINLFEIAFLKEDQVKLFRSDFGIVADYFVQKRKYGSYRPEPVEFTHIQETLQLLSVMTGDHRFEEVIDKNGKGGPRNMCEVLDRVENRGIEKGIEKGIKKIIYHMFDSKKSPEDISSLTGVPIDYVYRVQKEYVMKTNL